MNAKLLDIPVVGCAGCVSDGKVAGRALHEVISNIGDVMAGR